MTKRRLIAVSLAVLAALSMSSCSKGGDEKSAIDEKTPGTVTQPSTIEDPQLAFERNKKQATKEVNDTLNVNIFGQTSDTDARVSAVERGDDARDFISNAFENPDLKSMSLEITNVNFLEVGPCNDLAATPKPCGQATVNVLSGGQPTDQTNVAVYVVFPQCAEDAIGYDAQDTPCGRWKLSRRSFCDLLSSKGIQGCPEIQNN